MVCSPSRAAVRAMRQAISPRLAIKTEANMPWRISTAGGALSSAMAHERVSAWRAGPAGPGPVAAPTGWLGVRFAWGAAAIAPAGPEVVGWVAVPLQSLASPIDDGASSPRDAWATARPPQLSARAPA